MRRAFWWSLRRELWENRSVTLGPVVVAGLFLVGFLVSLVRLPSRMRAAAALGPAEQQAAIEQPYVLVSMALMAIFLIVAAYYCLDALYGERRDRSSLFWKSMPVSDATAVLAKASIPIVVLPLVTFALTMTAHLVMLIASGAVLAAAGVDAGSLWSSVPFLEVSWTNFHHVVAFHGLWYAPFYGWLLLASAWARRAPLLWATVPPVALGVLERIALGTSHLGFLVRDRFLGVELAGSAGAATPADAMTMDMLASGSTLELFLGRGMWGGFAVTAAFLFAATRLHRSRGAI